MSSQSSTYLRLSGTRKREEIMAVRNNFSMGVRSAFWYDFHVANDAVQMILDVHKALTLSTPQRTYQCNVIANSHTKCTWLAVLLLFHSCLFSHSIKLLGLLLSAVIVSLHYLPNCLRSTVTCGKMPMRP